MFRSNFKREDLLFLIFILIAFPICCYNLGLMPFLDDEPTRALVSYEMSLSGEYLVPTLAGDPYLNKPPLINFMWALIMKANPSFTEFSLRLPALICFFVTAIILYLFIKRQGNIKLGLFVSIAYLTCGRVLFYDSMLAYIDPFFSLFLILESFVIYKMATTKPSVKLWVMAYLCLFLAYMCKGFPAIAFHGLTLIAAAIYRKEFRFLFGVQHIVCTLLFLLPTLAYYYIYAKQASLNAVLAGLWGQSSQRTMANFGLQENITFFLSFPFQVIIDFLPWTLPLFFLLHKGIRKVLFTNPLSYFSALLLLLNFWIYWLSPETRPRYLFMFLPFLFVLVGSLPIKEFFPRLQAFYETHFYLFIGILAIVLPLVFFIPEVKKLPGIMSIVSLCVILILFIATAVKMFRKEAWFGLALSLLVLRFAFNYIVLPLRQTEAPESVYKENGKQIGKLSMGSELKIIRGTGIDHDIIFYAEKERGTIVSIANENEIFPGDWVLVNIHSLPNKRYNPIDSFQVRYQQSTIVLCQTN